MAFIDDINRAIAESMKAKDPARLAPEYERKGWAPRGATKGAIPGLEFLPQLNADDKRALIAFLRSL